MPDSRHPAARLLSGAFWSGAGTAAFQVLALVASMLVARQLSTEDFGAFGLLQSTIATFGLLGAAGMGLTAVRYAAELRRADPARAGRVLALANLTAYAVALALGLATFLQAGWIAGAVLNQPALADELRVASLAMVLTAVASVQAGALAGFEAFRALALLNLVRGVLTLVGLPAGAALGGVRGVMVALGAIAVVTFLAGERATLLQRRKFGVRRHFAASWQEWRVLIAFALPAYVTGFVYPAVLWGLGALIVQQPAGYAAMALFSAAAQWRLAVAFLPQLLSQPALTVLANVANADGDAFRRVYRLALWLTTLSALVPGLLLALLAGPILSIYGPAYVAGAPVLVWLVVAVMLNAPCLIIGSALASRGHMWLLAGLNGTWAAAVFGFFAADLGGGPAERAAMALAAGHVVHLAASLLAFRWIRRSLPRRVAPAAPPLPHPAPQASNTCVVVVTYHPEPSFADRFAAMAGQAAAVVVVDNGSTAETRQWLQGLVARQPHAVLIENDRNLGIARALNQGAEAAHARGCAWLLAFDQDTEPAPELLAELAAVFANHPGRERLAVIGAAYRGAAGAAPFVEPPAVITSGSLLSLAAYDALGPFADDYFIDYVDVEYCLRARGAGYRIAQSSRPLMRHAIGRAEPRRLLWWRTVATNHAPERHYTATRNLVWLVRGYGSEHPAVVVWLAWSRCKVVLLALLLESHRLPRIRAMLRGLEAGMGRQPAARSAAGVAA
jgi:GT2 family glycosyltransferase/O-antigen/teichoic acid export membrane protein